MKEKELLRNAIIGCAVGDALGAPFEFGYATPQKFSDYYDSGECLEITDDTQMSLFTLDGMVHAFKAGATSVSGAVDNISSAYLSWYTTQRGPSINEYKATCHLLQYRDLYQRRLPGNTCLASLDQLNLMGKVSPNDRKGAGANMRIVPLAFLNLLGIELKSEVAREIAIGSALITHKHPLLMELMPIQLNLMASVKGNSDFRDGLRKTVAECPFPQWLISCIANADHAEGWVAEEALGVAIAANCRFGNFKEMMTYCICRSGDSDTIAAIAGGLWGLSGKSIPDNLWQRTDERILIEDFLDWTNRELGIL